MDWVSVLLTVLSFVFASSGFWAWMSSTNKKRSGRDRLLVGLGHDRIMSLGMTYIQRGYVTREEYENLYEYLYKPYTEMGGNGSAQRIMQEINKLPIHDN